MYCKYCGKTLIDGKCPGCGRAAALKARSTEWDALKEAEEDARNGRTYRQGLREGYQKGLQEGYANGVKHAAQANPATAHLNKPSAAPKGKNAARPGGRKAMAPAFRLAGSSRVKWLIALVAALLVVACVALVAYRAGVKRGSAPAAADAVEVSTESAAPVESAEATPNGEPPDAAVYPSPSAASSVEVVEEATPIPTTGSTEPPEKAPASDGATQSTEEDADPKETPGDAEANTPSKSGTAPDQTQVKSEQSSGGEVGTATADEQEEANPEDSTSQSDLVSSESSAADKQDAVD